MYVKIYKYCLGKAIKKALVLTYKMAGYSGIPSTQTVKAARKSLLQIAVQVQSTVVFVPHQHLWFILMTCHGWRKVLSTQFYLYGLPLYGFQALSKVVSC